jgi:hypothetical protein
MTEHRKPNRYNKPVNATMDDKLKEELSKLADKNALTLSGLFRWLGTRAVDGPEQFGLLPVKQEHKQ